MAKFFVQGGKPLMGSIEVKGSKNAALPLLASSVLTSERCVFDRVPKIRDIRILLEIMEGIGAKIEWLEEEKVAIQCDGIQPEHLSDPTVYDKVRLLRASVLLVAPLLVRFGQVRMPYPGGCILGKRPLDAHFEVFQKFGAKVDETTDQFTVSLPQARQGAHLFLSEASVTATENALMLAAAIPEGESEIRNAASEPHVSNLAHSLEQMGAAISGIGTNMLRIKGVAQPKASSIAVVPDQLEAGSLAIAAAATRGEMVLSNIGPDNFYEHLEPIFLKLDQAGVNFSHTEAGLKIAPPKEVYRPTSIRTNIWPGFPSDLQAPFCVLMTQAEGNSMIHDWMYEGRLFYIDKLIKMGADITMADPHRVMVSGSTPLHGKSIESPDIRAGMALLIAALMAEGESEIEHVELIDRGYLKLEERLGALGAKIERR